VHIVEPHLGHPTGINDGLLTEGRIEIEQANGGPAVDEYPALDPHSRKPAAALDGEMERRPLGIGHRQFQHADGMLSHHETEAQVALAAIEEPSDRLLDRRKVAARSDAHAATPLFPRISVDSGVETDHLVGDRCPSGVEQVCLGGLGGDPGVELPEACAQAVGVRDNGAGD